MVNCLLLISMCMKRSFSPSCQPSCIWSLLVLNMNSVRYCCGLTVISTFCLLSAAMICWSCMNITEIMKEGPEQKEVELNVRYTQQGHTAVRNNVVIAALKESPWTERKENEWKWAVTSLYFIAVCWNTEGGTSGCYYIVYYSSSVSVLRWGTPTVAVTVSSLSLLFF